MHFSVARLRILAYELLKINQVFWFFQKGKLLGKEDSYIQTEVITLHINSVKIIHKHTQTHPHASILIYPAYLTLALT